MAGARPAFGQDNAALLQDLLGLDTAAYRDLAAAGVIAAIPTSGAAAPQPKPRRAVDLGLLPE